MSTHVTCTIPAPPSSSIRVVVANPMHLMKLMKIHFRRPARVILAGADDVFESEDIIQQRVQLFKAADKYRRKPTLQLPKRILSYGGSLIASTCAAKDKCSNDLNECVTVGCNCLVSPAFNYILLAIVLKVCQPLIKTCSAYNGNKKRSASNSTVFFDDAAKRFMAALRAPPYHLNLKVSSQTLKPMVDEMLGLKVDDLGISRTPFGLELDALQSQLLAMQQESEDTAVQSSSSSLVATSTLGKDFVRQAQEGVFLHTSHEVSSTSMTASSSVSSTVPKK